MLTKAYKYASKAHNTQTRNDGKTAYINHPIHVAYLVSCYRPQDTSLICAAVLHDTIEDTCTNYAKLVSEFNIEIATLVQSVTDDPKLTWEQKKLAQITNGPLKTDRQKILKMCDKMSNLESIIDNTPDWTTKRIYKYIYHAQQVINNLTGVEQALDADYDKLCVRLNYFMEKLLEAV